MRYVDATWGATVKALPIALIIVTGTAFGQQPVTKSPYEAAERQYHQIISAFLEAPRPCPGSTPEVAQKQAELAETLTRMSTADGPRVLLFAVAANSLEAVQRFVSAGAPRVGDNGSLLHAAARFADTSVLEFLVRHGEDIEAHGGASAPAIFVAVESGRDDNVKWLLRRGANVNAVAADGGPLIRYSLVCRDQSVVDLLIESGAKPDNRSREVAARIGIRL